MTAYDLPQFLRVRYLGAAWLVPGFSGSNDHAISQGRAHPCRQSTPRWPVRMALGRRPQLLTPRASPGGCWRVLCTWLWAGSPDTGVLRERRLEATMAAAAEPVFVPWAAVTKHRSQGGSHTPGTSFLTAPEAGGRRGGCQRRWCLLRPLFLPCTWLPSPCVLTRSSSVSGQRSLPRLCDPHASVPHAEIPEFASCGPGEG